MDVNKRVIGFLNNELPFKSNQITSVIKLIEDKNTIPFIARYRKEATDNLDEVEIKLIVDKYNYLTKLEDRKEEVIRLISEQDKMTDKILNDIKKADKLQMIDDIYRPFKQKRKTLAGAAREKGLEPLALLIMSQPGVIDLDAEIDSYINPELDVNTSEDVLNGVHEIMAEIIGDNPDFRGFFRKYTFNTGIIETKVKDKAKDERKVYEMYYNYQEKVSKLVSHRALAINRAEKEDVLKVDISVDLNEVFNFLNNQVVTNENSACLPFVITAYEDAYKRFIAPAIEREIRNEISDNAQEQAVKVFSENLFNLLLQAPIKNKVVMGFDPAYRTGCKLAIVDESGMLLKVAVIYPHASSKQSYDKAENDFIQLINDYQVDLVAIGNGTASRESEVFVAKNIKKINHKVNYIIVNEAGASVYSASDLARQEFPDLQVEERSAVSIARRIQDPLAELVKVDPKSIGVGQYQHDIAEKVLDDQLTFVVENAVNQVGVDINSASFKLLEYISGLNKTVANNIIEYRNENNGFKNRNELKKVARFGPKSFEQAIGFIRVFDGDNILDSTKIHPESYKVANQVIKDFKLDLKSLGSNENNNKLKSLDIEDLGLKYAVGIETLTDIIEALKEPLRDIRADLSSPSLRSDVLSIKDLKIGLPLSGTVRNVVDFGVFVDIGLDNDGLVHISQISNSFIKHPSDILKIGDQVKVTVLDFDVEKGRVQLTMI
ncbi:MAG: RNA-binding transcriptional accessory protein [Erysipelothrix sp.]|nr:RNA-binding transcriptional accessory protein [Erysipelothrix sp.]